MSALAIDRLVDDILGAPPARGRRGAPLQASFVRNLNEADIQLLWDQPAGSLDSNVRPLVKIRASHHGLARLIADGKRHEECALITGYDVTYISNIQNDPGFKGLVDYYKAQIEGVYINVHERLAALGIDTIEELQDRLATAPEKFTTRELQELAALTLDRAGYGPKSHVQHSGAVALVGSDAIARIKDEVEKRHRGTTKSLYASSGDRPALGSPIIDGTLVSENALTRSAGEGDDLSAQGGKALISVSAG